MNIDETKASLDERGLDPRHAFGVMYERAATLERELQQSREDLIWLFSYAIRRNRGKFRFTPQEDDRFRAIASRIG